MQPSWDPGFSHFVALSSRTSTLNPLSQGVPHHFYSHLIGENQLYAPPRGKVGWERQPAQEDENFSTGALILSSLLPWFVSAVDSQFNTWHFLNEDALNTHVSLMGRICPATADPKTPSRQVCFIHWRSLSTDHVLHPVSWTLSWGAGSAHYLPTSPMPRAFCPLRVLPNRWLFTSTPTRDRGSKTVVQNYCSPEKELREWEWFIKKTYKLIGQLMIRAV